MSEKVRRFGVIAVAMIAGAGLIRISNSSAFAVAGSSPILKLKVEARATSSVPNPMPEPLEWTAAASPPGDVAGSVQTLTVPQPVVERKLAWVWAIKLGPVPRGRMGVTLARRAANMARRVMAGGPVAGRVVALSLKLGSARPVAVLSNAPTVADLLLAYGVRLEASDRVSPKSNVALRQGGRVRVVRIRTVMRAVAEAVPYQTIIRYSKAMVAGLSVIRRPGVVGRAVHRYRVTLRNGRPVARVLLSSRLLLAPVSQVVVEGAPAPGSHTQTGVATWYACAGLHAAHLSLPFGTVVKVTDLSNGRTVTVVINDRGPFAPGTAKIIDLCSPAFSLLAPLWQGTARVRLSW